MRRDSGGMNDNWNTPKSSRQAVRLTEASSECHAQHQCNRAGATLRPAVEALS